MVSVSRDRDRVGLSLKFVWVGTVCPIDVTAAEGLQGQPGQCRSDKLSVTFQDQLNSNTQELYDHREDG